MNKKLKKTSHFLLIIIGICLSLFILVLPARFDLHRYNQNWRAITEPPRALFVSAEGQGTFTGSINFQPVNALFWLYDDTFSKKQTLYGNYRYAGAGVFLFEGLNIGGATHFRFINRYMDIAVFLDGQYRIFN